MAAGLEPDDLAQLSPRIQRVVRVAREVGAPLGDALDAAIAAEDDRRQGARAVAVASAQTRVVAGGLVVAPLVLVPVLGRLVGADVVGFYRSGLGLVVLAVGIGALALGAVVVFALVRRVSRPRGQASSVGAFAGALTIGAVVWWLLHPVLAVLTVGVLGLRAWRVPSARSTEGLDEAVDLIATAQAGGVNSAEALRIAAVELPPLGHALRRLAFDLDLGLGLDVAIGPGVGTAHSGGLSRGAGRPDRGLGPGLGPSRGLGPGPGPGRGRGPGPGRGVDVVADAAKGGGASDLDRLAAVIIAAHEVGAPIAPTLRRLAADLRADDLAQVLAAAERLPAQLTFPTALCLLPGTVLLVGAPIVQAGLSAAGT